MLKLTLHPHGYNWEFIPKPEATFAILGAARASEVFSTSGGPQDATANRMGSNARYRRGERYRSVDYKVFLTLWKDADPDSPILIAAKSEYAKLK